MRNYLKNLSVKQGFTLIELLGVIGVLGVLAAALLVTINPLEQLARGRDSGRKSTVDQLGHAVEAYYVANSLYPAVGIPGWAAGAATWQGGLQSAGEVKIVSNNPAYASGYAQTCAAADFNHGNYCYGFSNGNPANAVVYGRAESLSEWSKAGCT